MTLTYRTKRRLQRIALVSLVLALVFVTVWGCWVVWLERYMVYSRDGASLDFDRQFPTQGQLAAPPTADQEISIYYNEGDNTVVNTTDLTQMTGYYIDASSLDRDLETTLETVADLPSGTPVMIEVKDAKGRFYYNSTLEGAGTVSGIDTAAVDKLIADITADHYAIAILPAFRDYTYGLNHDTCGLPVTSGGYLWADNDYCYWLNPTHSQTMSWLKQIVEELRYLGFDEVVFTEFRFPDTDAIRFSGDRDEAIAKAAAEMVTSCATSTFAVSFQGSQSFPLPQGRSRLYLQNVAPKDVASVASSIEVADPTVNLVFMISTFDTRFDGYSVIRPIDTYADAQ